MSDIDHDADGAPTMSSLSVDAKAAWVAGNSADAARLSACYRLYRQCVSGKDADSRPGYAVIDPFDVCCSRLVALFAVSLGRASTMIDLAVGLTERYPAVLEALAAGRLEQRVAELLARQLRTVDPDVLPQVQQEVVDAYLAAIESGERPGDGAVRGMADEIIRRVDADGIRRRRQDASRERGASIRNGADGMSTLWATLAADEAAVLSEAIDRRAAEFANPDSAWNTGAADSARGAASGPAEDTAACPGATGASAPNSTDNPADMSHYSVAERRADALISLVLGEQPGGAAGSGAVSNNAGSGSASSSADSEAADHTSENAATPRSGMTPLRPRVTVFAPAGASGQDGAEPEVQFPRTGESSIAALLAMLGSGSGATIERIDPEIGAADHPRRGLEYRPSAALARTVRLRDGTCRHPGCTVAAEYCDLDHLVPFDHDDPAAGGRTEEANLGSFCRRHHRFKHFSGWDYSMDPDGTLLVITPDGDRMITRPSGPLAAHRREVAKAEQDKWGSQIAWEADKLVGEDGPPAEPTYWHRRAQRIRAERKATEGDRVNPPPQPTPPQPTPQVRADDIPNISINFESRVERELALLLDRPPF